MRCLALVARRLVGQMSTRYQFPSKHEQQLLREVDLHSTESGDGSQEHKGAAAFEAVFNSHLWDLQTTYVNLCLCRCFAASNRLSLPHAKTGSYYQTYQWTIQRSVYMRNCCFRSKFAFPRVVSLCNHLTMC